MWNEEIRDSWIKRRNYERVKIGEPLRRRKGAYISRIYNKDQLSKGLRSYFTGF